MRNSRVWALGMAFGLSLAVAAAGAPAAAESGGIVAPALPTTGVIDVVEACDLETGRHETHYYLQDLVTGRARRLHFDREPEQEVKSGDVVKLSAVADASGELTVPVGVEKSVAVLASTGDLEKATQNRNSVVLLVNFKDKVLSVSKSSISQWMYDLSTKSVDGLYRESSFGQLAFPGDTDGNGQRDVFGPYTINYNSTSTCDYYTWGYAAEDKAVAAGVDLGLYRHIIYVFPDTSCSWAGMGNVGCGTVCRVWVDAPQYSDVYGHELGHNLGLRHAASDTNNDGTVDSEYGDKSDIMGYSGAGWRQFNAPHKIQAGWFSATPAQIVTVKTSGTYRIAPLELKPSDADLPQVLKIASATSGEYYYLGFRVRSGYDATLNTMYSDGCTIHRYKEGSSNPTRYISTLRDGNTFSDTAAKLTVMQVAHNSDAVNGYLDVQITLSTTADTVKPTVTGATARDSRTVRVTYSENMTNNSTLVDKAQYTFTGATSVSAQSVTRIDGRNVDVAVNEMKQGGSYTVAVGNSGPSDLAGNKVNSSADTAGFAGFGLGPTVTIARKSASPTDLNTVSYTVTFSEPVAPTFTSADITVTGTLASGTTVSVSGTDPNYTVNLTPSNPNADGTLGVKVGGTVTDKAGNLSPGGTTTALYTIDNSSDTTVDTTPPTVIIKRKSATPTAYNVVTYAVRFSEPVAPTFTLADLVVVGTLASSTTIVLGGTDPVYTVALTPSNPNANGTIGIDLKSGAVTDTSGNVCAGSTNNGLYVIDNSLASSSGSADATVVQAIVNALLDSDDSFEFADFSGDGTVDALDVQAVINEILEGQ